MKLLTGNDQSTTERVVRMAVVTPLLFGFAVFGYLFLVFVHLVQPFPDALEGYVFGIYVGAAMDMLIAMSILKRSDAVLWQREHELAEAKNLLREAADLIASENGGDQWHAGVVARYREAANR